MVGTILFYNLDDGSGLILSKEKKKYNFNIKVWDDLDTMPSVGLKVEYQLNNDEIISIQEYHEELKEIQPADIRRPHSVEDAARMIIGDDEDENLNLKLDTDMYSVKTVPNGLIDRTMQKFFSSVQTTVDKYQDYFIKGDEESLDFFRMKRFLFTAYNNILEMDVALAEGALMDVYRNIQEVNSIHDVYKKSYMYPKIAFSTIFLKFTRYKEAKARLERNISEMGSINTNLNTMESEIKHLMEEIAKMKLENENIPSMKERLKHVKRLYVDAIDRMGTLREENELLVPITDEYFEMFFEEFNEKFISSYEQNIKNLVYVLDSMAFLFDRLMWEKASHSKMIQRYFSEAGISYPYSSLTYLRYYLKTLNTEKLTPENKELFELLEYLEKKNKKEQK